MSTIAFRDGIIAGDREAKGDGFAWAGVHKIFGNRHAMAGVTGRLDDIAVFQHWFERWSSTLFEGMQQTRPFLSDGPVSTDPKGCEAIVVCAHGPVYIWHGTPFLKSIELCQIGEGGRLFADQPGYVAIGSGEHFAMAAMCCGRDAASAVMTAVRLQGFTAQQEIDTLSFAAMAASEYPNGLFNFTAADNRPKFPPKPDPALDPEPEPAPVPSTDTIQ